MGYRNYLELGYGEVSVFSVEDYRLVQIVYCIVNVIEGRERIFFVRFSIFSVVYIVDF